MLRTHYFVDTNFLIDFPELSVQQGRGWSDTQFFFVHPQPYVLVICDVVIGELDRLKNSSDEKLKYKVRTVTKNIENALENNGILRPWGHLVIFDQKKNNVRGDQNILRAARAYAKTLNNENMTLVTNDALFRIRSKDEGIECLSPGALELKIRTEFGEEHDFFSKAKNASQFFPEVLPLLNRKNEMMEKLRSLGEEFGSIEEINLIETALIELKQNLQIYVNKWVELESRKQEEEASEAFIKGKLGDLRASDKEKIEDQKISTQPQSPKATLTNVSSANSKSLFITWFGSLPPLKLFAVIFGVVFGFMGFLGFWCVFLILAYGAAGKAL